MQTACLFVVRMMGFFALTLELKDSHACPPGTVGGTRYCCASLGGVHAVLHRIRTLFVVL